MKCIFCESRIPAKCKKEHIINASIGGTLTAPGLVCSSCNERFAVKIDSALADKYSLALNILSPVAKKISHTWRATLKDAGDEAHFAPGMVVIPREKPIYDKDTGEIHGFFAKIENADRMSKVIKKIRPGKKIIKKYAICKEHDMPIRSSILLHEDELRVVSKMAYEYLRCVGGKGLQNELFLQLREYVMGANLSKRIAFLNSDTGDVLRRFDSINKGSDFCHRIVVSGGSGVIEAAVILFNRIGYYVLLAEKYSGSPFSYLYQKNILKNSPPDFTGEYDASFPCGGFQAGGKDYVMNLSIEQVFGLCRDGSWYLDINNRDLALKRYLGGVVSDKSDGDKVSVLSDDILNGIFEYADRVFADRKEDKAREEELTKLKGSISKKYVGKVYKEVIPNFSEEVKIMIWDMHTEVMLGYRRNIGTPLYGIRHFSTSSEEHEEDMGR